MGNFLRERAPRRTFQRKDQIKTIWGKHHEIKRLHVIGMSNQDIARTIGVSPRTVSSVLNSSIMKEELDKMQNKADDRVLDIMEDIRSTAVEAQKLAKEMMRDPNRPDSLRYRIALDQLNLAGYVKPHRIEGQLVNAVLSAADIKALQDRALNAAKEIQVLAQDMDKNKSTSDPEKGGLPWNSSIQIQETS